MGDWKMLIWLTQLGLSVALPLVGFVLLGVWLHIRLGWGQWIVWFALALGVISAARGLWDSLKAMERMSSDRKPQTHPPASFNDHQ